jgi:hypothetical protein
MRKTVALLLPVLTFAAQPAMAQQIAYAPLAQVVVSTDAVTGGDSAGDADTQADADSDAGGERLMLPETPAQVPQGIAAYGPFRVLDRDHAALVDVTDTGSPAAFAAMVRDYPGIAEIEMVTCPGTEDDRANLRLGLMIHKRGIATHVPAGGFVGSGAVELFLAGAHRYAERGADFAVHSWQDDTGREPRDYAPNAPENRAYINYYEAVGMSEPDAKAFYAMTNSVPFASAKWLTRVDLAQWVRLDGPMPSALRPLDSAVALQ